ncbi:S1-like domain-containing RNA-binding protein [Barnesiella sp. An22]|uniref:CvfB family protein n=1 Tax=Barnesiella sp. An22 TaxID=1965590 RepID=UPI0032093CB6
MLQIGKFNTLKVVKTVDFGLYLDGGEKGEILLPRKFLPEKPYAEGDELSVFVYYDSEDRLIATTRKPYVQVGQFARLQVKSVTKVGAFLDWGVEAKDLLVPFREQHGEMQPDRYYIVYVYLDFATGRIVASAKLDKFLDNVPPEYTPNQPVEILVVQETQLGYKVIINNLHWGVIYHNEIFRPVAIGEHLQAYIKQVRDDERIDVSLQPIGYEQHIDPLSETILKRLDEAGGRLPLSDKSPAEEIARYFQCSKKSFKKAIGALYKARRIVIDEREIRKA